jgi:glycosyltransferase involved in cell wall biosynthesis
MSSSVDVSVIVPVYNGAAYLSETLNSLLAQKKPVREIIVIDDGSTDDSLAQAQNFGEKVRCFSQPHRGIGAARNFGLLEAQGQWIAFLDADDLWLPETSFLLHRSLAPPAPADGVFGRVQEFFSPELTSVQKNRFQLRSDPYAGALSGAFLTHRSLFQKIGLLREDVKVGEFVDWQARALQAGQRFVNIPDVVLRRRIHLTNTSHLNAERAQNYLTVMRDHLRRIRSSPAT